jgi:hypothetical protein
MSKIGYYRYKTTADQAKSVNLIINYAVAASMNIIPIEYCEPGKILKYLDKNGEYRFYPFLSYHKIYDNPSLIGVTNKFITSILNSQTNSQVIGYKNERRLDLTADLDEDQLLILSDIYTSPRVYLYIGSNNSDTASDWLEVKVDVKDNIVRRPKFSYGRIDLTITLPEHFTIKMI